MKKKNNKKLVLILVLLLVISVGYAALASNLKINGGSKVTKATWLIHWANPQVVPGSVTNTKPLLSENNTNATWEVTLNEPGDFYEFTIDAVNEGSIDAEILSIKSKYNGPTGTDITAANLPAYLEYEVTYADSNHTAISAGDGLDHGQTRTYRVRVAYSENIDPSDLQNQDIVTTFYFEVNYKQKDKTSSTTPEPGPSPTNTISIERQNEEQITVGDLVKIGDTEDFYVISTNSEKTVLLSKYNLKVGMIKGPDGFLAIMKPSDAGYGLQSETAIAGYQWGMNSLIYGGVGFAYTNYWDNGGSLKSQYATNFSGSAASYGDESPSPYVYDNTYATDPALQDECLQFGECYLTSEGYSAAYYVERYKSTLIGMGAPSTISGRLLSYEEAYDIRNMVVDGKSVIYNGQAYWLGSIFDETNVNVYNIEIEDFDSWSYDTYDFYGVRPVIEIPTSELN